MNRFHRMHRKFKTLDNQKALELAIAGDGTAFYPPFLERIAPYLGWIKAESVLTIRFDVLKQIKENKTILQKVVNHIARPDQDPAMVSESITNLLALNPIPSSHTKSDRTKIAQRNSFHPRAQSMFQELGGELLRQRMGFSRI